jgi:protein tyrosine/serine phosphatase
MSAAHAPVPGADRLLPLEGVHNFRDYGGYAVAGGGRLVRGLLWRSAQHRDATDADLAAIDALGIASIIDLRGESERADHPCRRSAGFSARVLFGPGETSGTATAPHLAAADGVVTGEEGAAALRYSYSGMPWRDNLLVAFRHYFAALEDGEPTLVHCFAGKDRTGLIVALFHRLMGVHEDDILADYLMTNEAGRVEERIAAGAKHIRERYGSGITDDGIRALMMVRPDYLATALDGITARHGSVAAYANDVLGLSDDRVGALRDRYIAP